MRGRKKIEVIFLVLLMLLIIPPSVAQSSQNTNQKTAFRKRRVFVTGFCTERLTEKEMRYWEKIKSIIFLTDSKGRHWHPTLINLWTQLENSGHAIYIELRRKPTNSNTVGGLFRIEQFDPQGRRHVAVIRLYLAHINQAAVGPIAARANGFIPFEYLDREERYVEVLGHELAHAAYILCDLQRAARVTETIEQTNEIFLSRRGQVEDDPEMLQRLYNRDVLLEELEAQAEDVEVTIWQELLRTKNERTVRRKLKHKLEGVFNNSR